MNKDNLEGFILVFIIIVVLSFTIKGCDALFTEPQPPQECGWNEGYCAGNQ